MVKRSRFAWYYQSTNKKVPTKPSSHIPGYRCMDNHLVSRAFSLYAELLQLHGQGGQLSDWLAGAAYRIRQLEQPVMDLSKEELAEQFPPEIVDIINEGRKRQSIAALEELIQLTPQLSEVFDFGHECR